MPQKYFIALHKANPSSWVKSAVIIEKFMGLQGELGQSIIKTMFGMFKMLKERER